jgi:prevent-host-death family protein
MKRAMRTLSDAEVKENFSAVLDDVTQGTEVAITRDGKEVARLIPSETPRLSHEEFLRKAAEIRARQPLNRSRAEDLVREDRDR